MKISEVKGGRFFCRVWQERGFQHQLAADLDRFLPLIIRSMTVWLAIVEGHREVNEQNVLWQKSCGKTTRLIQELLEGEGYEAKIMARKLLAFPPNYDHEIVLVANKQTGKRYLVDAAYLQFMASLFDLTPSAINLPGILVMAEDKIAGQAAVFIRAKKACTAVPPGRLMKDQDLVRYFCHIYDLNEYYPDRLPEDWAIRVRAAKILLRVARGYFHENSADYRP